MDNIYLIGFMGCGKSTIGKSLAKALNRHCIDLDEWMEVQLGRTIPQIFQEEGEAYFRNVETLFLRETTRLRHTVFSTGGGVIGREANRVFLKTQMTVYLEWPFDVLYQRIQGDPHRPLSKSYDQLLKLYKERCILYEQSATYIIKCQDETPNVVVKKILDVLKNQ